MPVRGAGHSAMRNAIILGCSGQDGRLLEECLLSKGYTVFGVANSSRCDITRAEEVEKLVQSEKPAEIYHLAAIHHSSEEVASEDSLLFRKTYDVNFFSLVSFLEAIRKYSPQTRLFYAASSHVFGNPSTPVQDEATPLSPDSVYGMSKVNGLLACRMFRQKYGVFASVGILYNHESHFRTEKFLSKKIIKAALEIQAGKRDSLIVGNLDAVIDWGYAPDYVEAMHRILQIPMSDEFIVATGIGHTVREFVQIAFEQLGLDWTKYVQQDSSILARKGPVRMGNPSKLLRETGWKPTVGFEEMIRLLLSMETTQEAK
jgi:GDPmannose 4,6-dehydratase